jgi:hypothetical protein
LRPRRPQPLCVPTSVIPRSARLSFDPGRASNLPCSRASLDLFSIRASSPVPARRCAPPPCSVLLRGRAPSARPSCAAALWFVARFASSSRRRPDSGHALRLSRRSPSGQHPLQCALPQGTRRPRQSSPAHTPFFYGADLAYYSAQRAARRNVCRSAMLLLQPGLDLPCQLRPGPNPVQQLWPGPDLAR